VCLAWSRDNLRLVFFVAAHPAAATDPRLTRPDGQPPARTNGLLSRLSFFGTNLSRTVPPRPGQQAANPEGIRLRPPSLVKVIPQRKLTRVRTWTQRSLGGTVCAERDGRERGLPRLIWSTGRAGLVADPPPSVMHRKFARDGYTEAEIGLEASYGNALPWRSRQVVGFFSKLCTASSGQGAVRFDSRGCLEEGSQE
jgi:hypothetical protein